MTPADPRPTVPRPADAPPTVAWLSALVLPPAVAAAFIPLRDHVAAADIALLLALVILVAATLGGRLTGAVAAVEAAFAFDLFFTRPYYSLRINRAEDLETAVLMLIVGVAIGEIVTRGKRDRFAAHVSRSNLERVSRITELAAGGEPPGRLIRVARRELMALLDLNDAEFERPPFFDALPRLSHSGLSIPPTLGADAPVDTKRSTKIELPVWAEGLEVGRFVLTLADDATGLEFAPRRARPRWRSPTTSASRCSPTTGNGRARRTRRRRAPTPTSGGGARARERAPPRAVRACTTG